MQRYIIRRLIQAIPLLIGITIVSFLIIHLAPGDPALTMIDPKASVAEMERVRTMLGLDKPLHIQYWRWFSGILQGDFGRSFTDGRPVLTKIVERIPATLELTVLALLVSMVIAIPIGVISATRQYSLFDYTATVGAFLGVAIPNFWFGMLCILVFSVYLGWLPSYGRMSLFGPPTLLDRIEHLILPVMVLGLSQTAGLTRYVRSSMLEVIRQDYIRTARSKGLSERVVIYRHALKNALIPVVTILGLSLPGLLGGALITEQVFAWPGMGLLSYKAIFRRDYPVVMGVNLMAAFLVVVGNFLADISYALIDPRVRYD